MKAVIYARVSSREQEREGYSIPAQRKLLSEYARKTGLTVAQEFVDVESAKNTGRKAFGEMLRVLRTDPRCRIVLVEKTDRLYRNRTDSVAFEELMEKKGVEIHLVKENRVISKNSRSQDKFMHDIHVAVAKNYSENLREEVKKGMREKAEQGSYPGRAPFGYKNNTATRAIDIDPERAPVLRKIYELYASGAYSLLELRKAVILETGVRFSRSYFETILKNRFYIGRFEWGGTEYEGNHPPLVTTAQFEGVQRVFSSRNKPKYRKHNFAFGGLLECAHDGCTVTAGLQKKKYVYYRCSQGRGKCELPYMPEPKLSDQLGELLKGIVVPEFVANSIVESIAKDQGSAESERMRRFADTQQIKYADNLKNPQVVRDSVQAILADPHTSGSLSGYVGPNNPDLIIQSGDLSGGDTRVVNPDGSVTTTTVQGNTAPDIQTTTSSSTDLNGVTTTSAPETTLTGATITIDNRTSKGDIPGVMVHESTHAGEAKADPAKFSRDAAAERSLPHDQRPQEQRANAAQKAYGPEIKKAVKQIEKDRKKENE